MASDTGSAQGDPIFERPALCGNRCGALRLRTRTPADVLSAHKDHNYRNGLWLSLEAAKQGLAQVRRSQVFVDIAAEARHRA